MFWDNHVKDLTPDVSGQHEARNLLMNLHPDHDQEVLILSNARDIEREDIVKVNIVTGEKQTIFANQVGHLQWSMF